MVQRYSCLYVVSRNREDLLADSCIYIVCLIGQRIILTGKGYTDDDVISYNLPTPSDGDRRFKYRRRPAKIDQTIDYCYPFHSACWTLLEQASGHKFLDKDIIGLFNVFESFPYNRKSRCLKWGHNYYFEDMLTFNSSHQLFIEGSLIALNKGNQDILGDPSQFDFNNKAAKKQLDMTLKREELQSGTLKLASHESRLLFLSSELLLSVISCLEFRDVLNLFLTCKWLSLSYGTGGSLLPTSFWETRFLDCGEAAFAQQIRPSSCSWKDWFMIIKSELKNGRNRSSLQNRRRIWKLGIELGAMVRTINEPGRALHGNIIESLPVDMRGSVSSLAETNGIEGCQELKRIYVHFGNGTLRTILPTYTTVSDRRLISGLTFIFGDGSSIDAGYVVSRQSYCTNSLPSPEFLWLVVSPFGLEAISLDEYPHHSICESTSGYRDDIGVTRWSLKGLGDIFLGLDVRLPLTLLFEKMSLMLF